VLQRGGGRAAGVRPLRPKGGTDAGATRPARRAFLALGCALALALAACSGGGGDATAPEPDPAPHDPGPAPHDPGPAPGPETGVQGGYVLARINDSDPGQLVTIANPDGTVIGLYRFDAATTLTLDPLQTFTLELHYSDDKSAFGFDDHGEFKSPGAVEGTLALTFYSDDYGDQFSGIAVDGTVAIQYDFDGDGQAETTFGFQRIN
jgi:hypothetical protein